MEPTARKVPTIQVTTATKLALFDSIPPNPSLLSPEHQNGSFKANSESYLKASPSPQSAAPSTRHTSSSFTKPGGSKYPQSDSKPSSRAVSYGSQYVDVIRGIDEPYLAREPLPRVFQKGVAVPTVSPRAKINENLLKSDQVAMTDIGSGACGRAFAVEGTKYVLKRAIHHSVSADRDLKHDFTIHKIIYDSLQDESLQIRIPKPVAFFEEDDQWWNDKLEAFPPGSGSLPRLGLLSERVCTIPKPFRNLLIETYCPEENRKAAKDSKSNDHCVVRIYLQRKAPQWERRKPMFFSLRNFKLYRDHLELHGINLFDLTYDMADLLAALHWKAHVDANDREIVLGSPCTLPDQQTKWDHSVDVKENLSFLKRTMRLHIIDFNQCQKAAMSDLGVQQRVMAFMLNDPYFPMPPTEEDGGGAELWQYFSRTYMRMSDLYLEEENKGLAAKFLLDVEDESRRKKAKKKAIVVTTDVFDGE